MGTENQSPSYLAVRENARKWLSETKEGQHTVDILKAEDGPLVVGNALNEDKWLDWEAFIEENKDNLIVSDSCKEARTGVELARKSNSLNAPPQPTAARWLRFFSPPMWYVLRKQIEVMDPDYWKDPKNLFREALDHPQWATVPADYIRGELEKYLGGKTNITLTDGS